MRLTEDRVVTSLDHFQSKKCSYHFTSTIGGCDNSLGTSNKIVFFCFLFQINLCGSIKIKTTLQFKFFVNKLNSRNYKSAKCFQWDRIIANWCQNRNMFSMKENKLEKKNVLRSIELKITIKCYNDNIISASRH